MGLGGKRIAEIRAKLGLTQADFAAAIRKTRETVGRWERGETEPKYEDVEAAKKLLRPRSRRE